MKPLLCGMGMLLACWCAAAGTPAVGEQPPYEDIVKDTLSTVEQFADILATIKANDKGSAEAATPQLKAAADKFVALRDQAQKSKQPSKAEKDRLAKLYAPKFEAAFKRLREETLRVKNIDIPGVEEALKELANLNEKKEPKDKKKGDK